MYGAKVPPLLKEDRPRWDKNQAEMKRQNEIKKLTKQNGGEAPTEAKLADAGLEAPLLSADDGESGGNGQEMEMTEAGGVTDHGGHGHGALEPIIIPADADLVTKVLLSINWYNKSIDDKFFCVIQLPITLIRRLTVPVVISEPHEPGWNQGFNRILMILNPPFTGAFLVRFYEDFTATYYYPFGKYPGLYHAHRKKLYLITWSVVVFCLTKTVWRNLAPVLYCQSPRR